MDELDDTIQAANNITGVIMERIQECTHMIAVVSPNTQGSWWVPFEIGVASRAERRISTYNQQNVGLPEYLNIRPIMTQKEHLKQFAYLYRNDKAVIEKTTVPFKAEVLSASDFHRELKTFLGG